MYNQKKNTTNLKTINNQKCQKIKLHGTLTTKELEKHLPDWQEGPEMGSRVGGKDAQQGSRLCQQGRAG